MQCKGMRAAIVHTPETIDCTPGIIDCAPGDIDCPPGDIDYTPGDVDCTPGDIDCTPGGMDMMYCIGSCIARALEMVRGKMIPHPCIPLM